jgi:hypothetical protein
VRIVLTHTSVILNGYLLLIAVPLVHLSINCCGNACVAPSLICICHLAFEVEMFIHLVMARAVTDKVLTISSSMASIAHNRCYSSPNGSSRYCTCMYLSTWTCKI